ncbi:MAG: hypothetical protein QOF48_2788 [Verrucomicrobiota bacterium]|jgi:hypothetical protein
MNKSRVTDPILDDFLREQLAQATQLASESDLVTVTPMGGVPPSQYVIEFRCRGLKKTSQNRIVADDGPWGFGVNFPANFLRGGFHPAEVLAYLGPVAQPWHPNLRPPFVCLEVRPAMPLTEIIFTLFDLLSWNLFSTQDEGLNHDASQWYRNQDPSRFPIDQRPLKRRIPSLVVTEQESKP